jgi:hypothetical protein
MVKIDDGVSVDSLILTELSSGVEVNGVIPKEGIDVKLKNKKS